MLERTEGNINEGLACNMFLENVRETNNFIIERKQVGLDFLT